MLTIHFVCTHRNKKLLPPPKRSTKRDVEKDDIDGEPRYMPAPVISPSRASILKTQVTNVWSSEEKVCLIVQTVDFKN